MAPRAARPLVALLFTALSGCWLWAPLGPSPRDAAATDVVARDVVARDAIPRDDGLPALCRSIALSPPFTSGLVGITVAYTAVVTAPDGSMRDVTAEARWYTSDATVATIDATGRATGVGEGTAHIYATFGGCGGMGAQLVVARERPSPLYTTPEALTLAVNAGTRQLRVWAYISDGESIELDGQPGLEWRSSNTAVATVDARGLLTPVSPGTTLVTARLDAVTSAPPTVVTITPPGG